MRGSRSMDNQRGRMSLPTHYITRESSKVSQDKTTDHSPCQFDSGTVSDLDVNFETSTYSGDIDDEKDMKDTKTTSQSWTDSGVHLDSGLGIESISSELDIQSPLPCTEKDIRSASPETSVAHTTRIVAEVLQDNDGDSPLHLAVVHGDPHLVFRILAIYPEYLNVTNHLSQTALHLAVLLGYVRIVRRLVVCGAHLHICDHRGDTPYHLACRMGHLESLKALTIPVIAKEVKEAGLKDSSLPDIFPRLNKHIFQQRNYEGLTCTHLALASSHKVLEYILLCGADINAKEGKSGKSVLHLCVERGHLDLIRFLITACKADVNARNYAQQTPLHFAHLQKRYRTSGSSRTRVDAMIRLLREHGGEPHELQSDSEVDTDSEDEED